MKIRNIEISDLEICSKILEKEYSKKPYYEEFEGKNSLKYLESKFLKNQKTSFIMEIDWKIIWFCISSLSYWADWLQAIIEEIVIDSDFQWLGYWKKMYFYVENFLKDLWVKSLMLWVQNDANAFNFHLKNGYFKSDEHSVMFKNL